MIFMATITFNPIISGKELMYLPAAKHCRSAFELLMLDDSLHHRHLGQIYH